jgi:hypothetical protein
MRLEEILVEHVQAVPFSGVVRVHDQLHPLQAWHPRLRVTPKAGRYGGGAGCASPWPRDLLI